MRLSHAFAMSLALHLAAVGAFSSGRLYREGIRPRGSAVLPKALSVEVRRPVIAVAADQARTVANSGPLRADRYFAPSEVDQRAVPVAVKPLVIPERAYMERKKGSVRLRAYIDEAGRVRDVTILSASPEGIFEQAAIEAVTGTVFSPARYQGLPVKTYKDLEIDIDPYESIRVP